VLCVIAACHTLMKVFPDSVRESDAEKINRYASVDVTSTLYLRGLGFESWPKIECTRGAVYLGRRVA
jgi:hypothetical protein